MVDGYKLTRSCIDNEDDITIRLTEETNYRCLFIDLINGKVCLWYDYDRGEREKEIRSDLEEIIAFLHTKNEKKGD